MNILGLKKLAMAGVLACLLLPLGAAATAAITEPAGLSVTIGDGLDEVTSGTAVSYTAELRNAGSEAVSARLVISVPDYAEITAAEGGEIAGVDATWAVTVEPGATTTVIADALIGEIPEGEFRVTTLVSVYLGDEAAPLIRSADANLIKGVTDPSTVGPGSDGKSAQNGSAWVLPATIVGGALLVAAIVITILMLRARRLRSRAPRRRTAG